MKISISVIILASLQSCDALPSISMKAASVNTLPPVQNFPPIRIEPIPTPAFVPKQDVEQLNQALDNEESKQSLASATFNLVKVNLGSGVLALPVSTTNTCVSIASSQVSIHVLTIMSFLYRLELQHLEMYHQQ